jgi:succinyl-diaminopimelate desuccinylase
MNDQKFSQLYRHLDACVRDLRAEMIDFTSELVAIASENPPGSAYAECVRAIMSRLRGLGLPCERLAYVPRRGVQDESGAAIVLSHLGAGKRTLYFSGHYDVVPVSTPGQCRPKLRGRALFGRGTADMKGGLASMLYAVVALKRLRVPLDGRVGLVFVPDEETGGRRGSGFLAATKRLGTNGVGMMTPEPTSGVVWNANRGALTVQVTVLGRQAHVGLLHQGRNAFEDAVRVVTGLQKLGRRVGTSRARTRGHGQSAEVRDVSRSPGDQVLCREGHASVCLWSRSPGRRPRAEGTHSRGPHG